MILVRKNVYKDVCLLKMFQYFVRCFEMCVFVFENNKDCFEIEQVTRSYIPTQKSFLFIFFSFDIIILPLIW